MYFYQKVCDLYSFSSVGSCQKIGKNLKIDMAVDPGDSGGPKLNAEGLVVGMVRSVRITFGGQRVEGTFYAIHVAEIRDALVELKQGRSRLQSSGSC